ncbi:asparaginase [Micromonospora sp. WMMD1102]|uniref:asparaginase n=1 Tax=Micromonospora sp. WMMD1102 TaxID=3016105 RepID=UPI002415134F|nr:asparaginase [Micromonospora sp. WMMD1102]MDG4789441.1 asparaginase [Micromonospora sp. WMMD1102]
MASRVLMLATRDTIAYSTTPGREGAASGAELLGLIPPERLTAEVVVEDVLAEPSWDTGPGTMLGLARRARTAVVAEGFDGVVVSHGTDTLEETAYLADLLAGAAAGRGPIVFTGARRQLDELSADGPRNLASSITAAADPVLRGAGAVVCVDDEVHAARWVSLVDATTVRGFSSAPFAPLGRVVGERVELFGPAPSRPPQAYGEPESDVALLKTYPGMDAGLLRAVTDAGARGVVLEGTGPGNVPAGLFAAIAELVDWDIPVVVASRCRTGAVDLAELPPPAGLAARVGAIGARGLPAAKARVALMVALGNPNGGGNANGDAGRASVAADAAMPNGNGNGDGGGGGHGGAVAAARDWFDRLVPPSAR